MANKDFRLKIGADITELTAALNQAAAQTTETAEKMKDSLVSVSNAFSMVGEAALAVTAIMSGGKAFGEIIASTVNLNYESMELGKQFGISATQASVLKTALNAAFLTQDQFSAAATRITRTLTTNEQAFRDLGVATRDSNGNFRSTLDIMTDVNSKLLEFKEGTDRNIEGTKIYGRGWAQVADILRLTKSGMEDAQQTAIELNLAVSQEGLSATMKYKSAMNDMHEVLEGISNTIGQALMPILTSLGEWFKEEGPSAIAQTRAILATIANVFITLREVGEELYDRLIAEWQGLIASAAQLGNALTDSFDVAKDAVTVAGDAIGGQITILVDTLIMFGTVAKKALTLDFSGAKQAWHDGTMQIVNDVNSTLGKIQVDSGKLQVDWAALKGDWKAGDDQLEQVEKDYLKNLQNDQAQAYASMKTMEDTFFGQQHATPKTSAGDKGSSGDSEKEFNKQLDAWIKELDLEYAALKKQHDAEMEVYQQQEAEFSKAAGARVAIAEQEVEAEARAYGKGSPQYEAAQKHLIEIKQQANAQLTQMANDFSKQEEDRQLKEIDLDEKTLEEKLSRHAITNAQFEAQEIALEDKRTQILESGVRDRLSLIDPTRDPAAYAQLNAQIEQLEQEHQAKITQIKQQAALRDQQLQLNLFKSIQQNFSQNITKMLEGTETFSQGMRNLFKSILDSIIQFIAQWVTQWAAAQIANLLASKTSAVGAVGTQAAVAGASGVASFAGAPWPLDIGAPAFGAAMAAEAAGFGALASAEGGYDIGAREAPLVQTHPREMVLPATLSDGIRAMVASGNARGGGGSTSINIKANDSRSLVKSMRRGGSLEKAMRDLHRRGGRG